mgnify:CR=1 FL=1
MYKTVGEDAIKQAYMLGKTYQDFIMPENSTVPAHTQIAKDYYVQPLHGLAINLAEHTVLDVGKQIYEIWFRQWDIGVAEYKKHNGIKNYFDLLVKSAENNSKIVKNEKEILKGKVALFESFNKESKWDKYFEKGTLSDILEKFVENSRQDSNDSQNA